MKKFIQNNFTVIVLVIAVLTLFKSCGDSRDLSKIKSEYFFMDDFPEQNKLVRDSLFKKCDDDRCAYILLTNGFLVASYVMGFGNDFGTMIIDLKSKKDLIISFYKDPKEPRP